MSDSTHTHLEIDHSLCGRPVEIQTGERATVRLMTTGEMRADQRGLVHGGFLFGLADYAAMLAVNDPNVVLGAADVKFLAPVRVGEEVVSTATVVDSNGKKRVVQATASVDDRLVFEGTFTTFVLDQHVLD